WILIPLAALSIPIFGIIGENVILTSVVSGVVVLIAVTLAIRSLMTHRHRLKMEELEARERIIRAEREQLSAAEKILELDTPPSTSRRPSSARRTLRRTDGGGGGGIRTRETPQ